LWTKRWNTNWCTNEQFDDHIADLHTATSEQRSVIHHLEVPPLLPLLLRVRRLKFETSNYVHLRVCDRTCPVHLDHNASFPTEVWTCQRHVHLWRSSAASPLLSSPHQLVSVTHLFPFTDDVTNEHLPDSWRTQLRNLTLYNVVTENGSLPECDAVISCLVPDVSKAYTDFRDPGAKNNLTAWPLKLKTL